MPSSSADAEIRRARPTEAGRLTAVAHAAKRHWGYPAAWIRLWREELTVRPSVVRRQPVYCAERAGEVIGFYGLSAAGADCELEHLWVDPAHMGVGVGRALLAHALATARARGGRRLVIAADPNAEGFYRACGARRVGEIASRPAGRVLPVLELAL